MRILVVDDEKNIRRTMAMALESIVTFVRTGDDAHLVNPAFRDHSQQWTKHETDLPSRV